MGREIAGWVGLGQEGPDPSRVGSTRGLGQIEPKIAKSSKKCQNPEQMSLLGGPKPLLMG